MHDGFERVAAGNIGGAVDVPLLPQVPIEDDAL
jgi:hypothetical protein